MFFLTGCLWLRLEAETFILMKLSSWAVSNEGLTKWLHPVNSATSSRASDLTAAQRWSMEPVQSRCAADWRGYCRWMYHRDPCIVRRTVFGTRPLAAPHSLQPSSITDDPRVVAAAAATACLVGPQQRDAAVHNCGKIFIDSRIKPETLHQRLYNKSFPVANTVSW